MEVKTKQYADTLKEIIEKELEGKNIIISADYNVLVPVKDGYEEVSAYFKLRRGEEGISTPDKPNIPSGIVANLIVYNDGTMEIDVKEKEFDDPAEAIRNNYSKETEKKATVNSYQQDLKD